MAEGAGVRSAEVRPRRRPALGIRAYLLMMVLVPAIASVALASSAANSRWADRSRSVTTRSATLGLDELMNARAALTYEYVPSAAIVDASTLGISIARLDALLGIDFAGDMASARQRVNGQSVLHHDPALASDFASLLSLRRGIDAHTASFAEVQTFYTRFTDIIDGEWSSAFDKLATRINGASWTSATIGNDVDALRKSFSAFTAGLDQSGFTEQILTTPSTSQIVAELIGANALFASSTSGFPAGLGPKATAAWNSLKHDTKIQRFDAAVMLAVTTGLRHAPPPYATNLTANAEVFEGEIAKVNDLTALVLAESSDLRTTASASEDIATRAFVVEISILAGLAVLMVGILLWVARSFGRPLSRLVGAAQAVREGDFDIQPMEQTGPRELADATLAFNEMASALRAVETHTEVLAKGDLDDPVLETRLPGRAGEALQGALDRLQESVRDAERRREELSELASHDTLTGLMNRRAAMEAVERDLARAARDGGSVTLLFIDLDGLKTINDTLGHAGGDIALRAVADAVNSVTRRSDVRARLGGDEFLVSHPKASGQDGTRVLAERIRERVADTDADLHGHRMTLTCSIGVAESQPGDASADSLIHRADRALYEAKRRGGNQVAWYDPGLAGPPLTKALARTGGR